MNTSIIGGAMLPHAPQFFTRPETESKDTIAAVEAVGAEIGSKLLALQPDLIIMFSNDHAEQFFHTTAPPFTIHVGGEATGHFAGHDFRWKVPGEVGLALVRAMYAQGFDPAFSSTAKIDYAIGIPLTHLGIPSDTPVLPIYVNAYLPPQPPIERCYAFGQAVARAVTMMGLRTVVLASGGMSHFPGTDRYSNPELDWDNALLARLREGRLKTLIGLDEAELDETGNIELRCWGCVAGALGEQKPDIAVMNPSWHHNYASLGWFNRPSQVPQPHYPATRPELVELISAVHALAHDPAARAAYIADATGYADRFRLTPPQRDALIAWDTAAMNAMGTHPLVPFLANMQISRARAGH
jgi:2,3-dihydroxyphenylpropionate 1,2-dioxygenase